VRVATGRLLTLEDTIEFFNLVQGIKLTDQEKKEFVAFLRALERARSPSPPSDEQESAGERPRSLPDSRSSPGLET